MNLVGLALGWLVPVVALAQAAPIDGEQGYSPVMTQWLPAEDEVLTAIDQSLELQQARVAVTVAAAQQQAERIGSYEPQLQFVPQRREVGSGNPTQAGRYNEWEVDLQRSFRWPLKARLDRQIGADGKHAADLMADDASHESARRLLALWDDWQRSRVQVRQAQLQLASWQHEGQILARRIQLGDAAARDQLGIAAVTSQAEATLAQAQLIEQQTREGLQAVFPELALNPIQLPATLIPEPLPGSNEMWLQRTLQHGHEVPIAQALADQKELEAERARADRIPDLSVGIRALSDYGGQERAYGLVLGIPLGFGYRSAQATTAAAQAQQAQLAVAVVARDLMRDTRMELANARGRYQVWQHQQQAAAAALAGSIKAEHAYRLGESPLTDLLAARRMANDTALAAGLAAIDALEAVTRVEVDAHALWHREDSDDVDTSTPSQRGSAHSATVLPELGGS